MFLNFVRRQIDDGSSFPLNYTRFLGSMFVKVETFRYFAVTYGEPEKVVLVRDASNPYSPNAIKVLNKNKGSVEQALGYLDESASAVLSPLIDANLITIEGFQQRVRESDFVQNNNKCEVPCQVRVFAEMTECGGVISAIISDGMVISESNGYFTVSKPLVLKENNHVVEQKNVDEIFTLEKLKVCCEGEVEALEPPKSMIKTSLFPHQKEGLGWLVSREKSCELPPFWEIKKGVYVNTLTSCQTNERPEPIRGGIFADDMGLGKTLTLLSLIAYDKWTYSGHSSRNVDVEIKEDHDEQNNILSEKQLKRQRSSLWALKKKQKASNFTVNKMGKPFAFDKPCDSTLIVMPPAVLSTWISQLEKHVRPGSFEVYIYYGERTRFVEELLKYDIVITTYSTLASEFGGSPIQKIEWRRVILDEAHIIKNTGSFRSQAVHKLKAKRRWAVTGTPIQNNTFDLFPLMVFLKFKPFSIHKHWDAFMQHPLSQGDDKGIFRWQVLIASISLRRTKEKCLVNLPSKSIKKYLVTLSKEERKEYDQMEVEAKKLIEWYISDNKSTAVNYTAILTILMRLRQMCTDLALCPEELRFISPACNFEDAKKNPRLLEKLLLVLQDGDDIDCPICLSPHTDIVITCCAHIFCRACILKTIKRGHRSCPLCRHPLSESDLFKAPSESSQATSSYASSKVTALLQLLSESRDQNPSTKSVIFSHFRKLLLLLEKPLKEAGFKFLRLDGSLDGETRANIIERFGVSAPEGPTILLASLRASSAGINLTAASKVYLMEPSWTPGVDEQAMDRVYRIGQKDDVEIVRFIAVNTIDERLLQLQERKKTNPTIASGGKRSKDRKEITRADLRALMNL